MEMPAHCRSPGAGGGLLARLDNRLLARSAVAPYGAEHTAVAQVLEAVYWLVSAGFVAIDRTTPQQLVSAL